MELTLGDIRTGQAALVKILTYPMDFKVAYRMRKIASQLQTEMKHIEAARVELVKKYGVKDDNDKYTVPPDKAETVQQEFDDLLKMTVSLDVEPIPLECLHGLKVSPLEIATIEVFLEDAEKVQLDNK